MKALGFLLLLVALGLLFYALADPAVTYWAGIGVASVGLILMAAGEASNSFGSRR